MRRMLTPFLLILTALALALPAGSTRAAERGVAFAALLPGGENWYDYGPTKGGLYGQTAASAGDTNGDGYDEVIVADGHGNAQNDDCQSHELDHKQPGTSDIAERDSAYPRDRRW